MAGVKKKCLSCLTFREIEKELSRCPALILPLGGCEPYGASGTLGTATACAGAFAAALAEKLKILYAPALAVGCSTAYGSFGGTAGVKPRTMTNILYETIRRWQVQGFMMVIIIDGLFDNGEAVEEALRWLKNSAHDLNVVSFSLQRDERIRAFIGRHGGGKEPGRTEYGLLSLAAHIDASLVRPAEKKQATAAARTECYVTWRKRGADPQQFRKLFPECSVSDAAHPFDPVFGKELFGFILQLLVETTKPLLKSHHQADHHAP
jgi:creatinine amidohydrolase/Fe(II)-dependent formamide hydrolase-like protein